jgi:L-aspartate oxidase
MAYRAGAKIGNLEFMQFHPTTLYHPEANSFLISEAVRGFGGVLKNSAGEDFMKKYDERGSLAPRDIVARAIDTEMKRSGEPCVFLDLQHLHPEEIKSHFPNIYQKCLSYKLDITQELIPVVPAAHYMCGGVLTDLHARTSIANLYAVGEVACTGVHGANRLASNSLLEAFIFSKQAVEDAKNLEVNADKNHFPNLRPWIDTGEFDTEEWVLISHDKQEIQQLMWDYVGIVRSNLRLLRAERRIGLIQNEVEAFFKKTTVTPELTELRNIALVARLIIHCAMTRKESRGLHFTTDYPEQDNRIWKKDTILN